MTESETLDTAAASRRTGISVSTLQKWRVTGLGPTYLKLGRLVRYDAADLSAWLLRQRMLSTSEAAARKL